MRYFSVFPTSCCTFSQFPFTCTLNSLFQSLLLINLLFLPLFQSRNTPRTLSPHIIHYFLTVFSAFQGLTREVWAGWLAGNVGVEMGAAYWKLLSAIVKMTRILTHFTAVSVSGMQHFVNLLILNATLPMKVNTNM